MKRDLVVKELSTQELKDRLITERAELTRLKINHAISPLENPNVLVTHKKNIARILTELRAREIEK